MGAYFCLIGIAKPEPSELLAALEAIETPEVTLSNSTKAHRDTA